MMLMLVFTCLSLRSIPHANPLQGVRYLEGRTGNLNQWNAKLMFVVILYARLCLSDAYGAC